MALAGTSGVESVPQRFVIAGGPGSGKSTLLQALNVAGEICYNECSRALIREQLSRGGRLLPWDDLRTFALECAARMRAQLADSARHDRCFFDRGLPDLIGYLNHGDLPTLPEWRSESRAYSPMVFYAPPWREIYVNDEERPQTFAAAEELAEHVRRAYLDCGFEVIELVRGSVDTRVDQVIAQIEARPTLPRPPPPRFEDDREQRATKS
jgi:predicted ATPase